jgi:hypothetical protein
MIVYGDKTSPTKNVHSDLNLLQGQGHRVHKCCLKNSHFSHFSKFRQVFENGDLTFIWYIGLTKPFLRRDITFMVENDVKPR